VRKWLRRHRRWELKKKKIPGMRFTQPWAGLR